MTGKAPAGLFLLVLFLMPFLADAATINAVSCSQTDVQAAINNANSGDNIQVPAGNCTWNNQLVITKGIYLMGAGIGKTVITGNFLNNYDLNTLDPGNYLVVYQSATPALNEPFRLSGFTFDLALKSNGIMLRNWVTIYPISKVRIDHVRVVNQYPHHYPFVILGTVYGVMDSCELSNTRCWNDNANAWTYLSFSFGSANNFYFEDNNFTLGSQRTLSYGEGGTAFCFRHNNITLTADMFPIFDAHGNTAWHSTMGMEFYDNTIDATNHFMSLADQRGGMALIYNNVLTNVSSSTYIQVREELIDSQNPPANNVITGQPQHVSSSYYWNNLDEGTLIPIHISQTVDYGGEIGPVPQFDKDCWKQLDSFNGTTGMGVSPLSFRPATCTVGVGYWANDTKTLYKCNATDTWIAYYTPYIYPHPLRTDCVNYPMLCDSGTSATPVCNNGKTEAGEACDGSDLSNNTCASLPGFKSGTLKCKQDCSGYDISSCLKGNTTSAASCSLVDVQAAINSAQSGDTVLVPAGSCIWISTLMLNKSITLQGAGVDATKIINGGVTQLVIVSLPSDKPVRITGIYFDAASYDELDYSGMRSAIWISGNPVKLTKVRVDHCIIDKGQTGVWWTGGSRGVIDNCLFHNVDLGIRIAGDNDASWNRPIVPSSDDAVFIENNTFLVDNNMPYEPNEQIYHDSWGARSTVRYNRFLSPDFSSGYNAPIEAHGNWPNPPYTSRGVVMIEFYDNIFDINKTYRMMYFRGGSLLVYNNKITCQAGGCPAIQLTEEEGWTSGGPWCPRCPNATVWPAQDQISNSFLWNNTVNGVPVTSISLNEPETDIIFIQEGRDYWMHAPAATGGRTIYTDKQGGNETFIPTGPNAYYPHIPYVYPHSLVVESSSPTPIPGDINGDRLVNINDLSFIGTHFGQSNAHPAWNVTADVVANNEIDIYDVVFVASRFT